MQIISRRAFRFADTVISTDAAGNVEAKERAHVIVSPGYKPVTVEDWAANDATFKAALACGDVEVI